MVFTEDEMILMMIHNPGSRLGLKEELVKMREILEKSERDLKLLTDGVLEKLDLITDEEFDALLLYFVEGL